MLPACAGYAAAWSGRGNQLWSVWAASSVGWTLVLVLATFAHARSGHIPLFWSLGLSLGLLAALRWPAQRNRILLAACVPGLYTVVHFGPMLRTMLGQAGIQPLPIPAGPIIAVLCAILVMLAGAAIALPVQAFGLRRKYLSIVPLAGLLLSAAATPFTSERPRRVLVTQAEADGRSAFLFRARDALPLGPVLEGIAQAREVRPGWPMFEPYEPAPTHEVAGPAPDFAAPRIEVLSSTAHGDGTRSLQLRLHAETPNVRLFVEHGRVAAWSVHPEVAEPPFAAGRATVYFQGFDPAGENVSLTLRGQAPVEIELVASTFAPSPELRHLVAAFPDWALPVPLRARAIKQRL